MTRRAKPEYTKGGRGTTSPGACLPGLLRVILDRVRGPLWARRLDRLCWAHESRRRAG